MASMRVRWVDGDVVLDDRRALTVAPTPRPIGDALVALALPIAMRRRTTLVIDEPVTPRLLGSIPAVQRVLVDWYPKRFTAIEVLATPSPDDDAPAGWRGTGCFFSGGVDSWYTVIRRRDELTHLLFAIGFDLQPDSPLRDAATDTARAAAASLDLELIEVEAPVSQLGHGTVRWGEEYHGAAMAFVAHAMSHLIERVVVPGSYSTPWGSNIDLDPLWSGRDLAIDYDASGVRRVDKLRVVAEHETAMRTLRVCWRNPNGAYNCGVCEKCVRTMIGLRAVGALGRCSTLPATLDLDRVAALDTTSKSARAFLHDNLRAIRAGGGDPPLERALERSLRRRVRPGLARSGRRLKRAAARALRR